VGLVLPLSAARGLAAAAGRVKVVDYRGYRFEVPASWPVFNVARHPSTCVRFDLHAVYLGRPGANQDCPSWLLGATEAVVIQPGPRDARRVSQEDPVSDQITARAPRIMLTATFDTDPTTIYRILASAGLAAPAIAPPNPVRLAAAGRAVTSAAGSAATVLAVSAGRDTGSAQPRRVDAPALPATIANYVGLGFDVCAAPSASFMNAWMRYSPYGAIGIYIGGSDRACDQQNLTPAWVRREAAAGWRFIPMYAGPQASFGQLTSPASQGRATAEDAVEQAEKLGFGPRAPLYYDMEAYPVADSGPSLRFLSAWTVELHKLGYSSGVYSSSDSAIIDLAREYKSGQFAMPDVIYDALWNGSQNNADSVYGPGEWTGGRRLHQFSGNVLQTYGGDTMDIDQDYLDITLAAPGGTSQASPGVTNSAGSAAVFYQGSDDQLWEDSSNQAGGWTRADLGGYLTSAPSVVQVGADQLDVFYRGRGGWLWQLIRTSNGWRAPRQLAMMGVLGGAPRAVAQPNGVIDVFWQGSHDDHLWHAQYSPGQGWAGPQSLLGSLASWPYPVETRSGEVQVFWAGTDGNLWRVVRGLGRPWTAPEDLGMGRLGGAPRAVSLPSGEIDVFWRGSTRPHAVWSAVLSPGHRPAGPLRRGGAITGQPWPVATSGIERVLFRGTDGRFWMLLRAADGHWEGPVKLGQLGGLASAPFAAAGPSNAPLVAFWTDRKRRLWTASLTRPGGWNQPVDLGGRV
jgi:Domain of unknown function (DUF1906)